MAAENSFDVVSEVDLQEVRNAFHQAEKEIVNRYDLKKAAAVLTFQAEEITVEAADEYSLNQALDVLKTKLVKRNVNLKSLRYGKIEPAASGRAKQTVTVQQGIATEKARQIVKALKDSKIKVQAQIQDEQVRVSGKVRDDLQRAIQLLKQQDLDLPLQFVNFRD